MSEPTDWTLLLDRYLAGECTAAEAMEVVRRLARSDTLRAEVESLKASRARAAEQTGAMPTSRVGPEATQAALKLVERRLTDRGSLSRTGRGLRLWPRGAEAPTAVGAAWRAVRVAAAIVVVAGGVFVSWRTGWLAGGAQQFREFRSAPGSRTTITLADGTQFVLGPATHLKVRGDFGTTSRNVELDGEAMFTVVHDARRPFVVRTHRTIVRDVGTTFVVRAYAGDRGEQIAVEEGEVALPGVGLRARDVASVDSAGRVDLRRNVDVARYLAWTQGALAFKDTPFRDVARELARTYDLTMTIADPALDEVLVTASFANGESIENVLGEVTRTVGAHYERVGRSVVVRSGVRPAGSSPRPLDAGLRLTRGPAGTRCASCGTGLHPDRGE